jgi:hypothetical protein
MGANKNKKSISYVAQHPPQPLSQPAKHITQSAEPFSTQAVPSQYKGMSKDPSSEHLKSHSPEKVTQFPWSQ